MPELLGTQQRGLALDEVQALQAKRRALKQQSNESRKRQRVLRAEESWQLVRASSLMRWQWGRHPRRWCSSRVLQDAQESDTVVEEKDGAKEADPGEELMEVEFGEARCCAHSLDSLLRITHILFTLHPSFALRLHPFIPPLFWCCVGVRVDKQFNCAQRGNRKS